MQPQFVRPTRKDFKPDQHPVNKNRPAIRLAIITAIENGHINRTAISLKIYVKNHFKLIENTIADFVSKAWEAPTYVMHYKLTH
ncbi:hypothetical protein [Paraglaciecola psychrophila]|uniref:hypothetical protein n=1 Tax=Paraglaciecola psychrophila TaxID=326544 RepID=UPI00054D87DC|nr:hypothetical protein [Paraglaciecola psychrophila]